MCLENSHVDGGSNSNSNGSMKEVLPPMSSSPGILRRVLESAPPLSEENDENSSPHQNGHANSELPLGEDKVKDAPSLSIEELEENSKKKRRRTSPRNTSGHCHSDESIAKWFHHSPSSFYDSSNGKKTRLKTYSRRCRNSPLSTYNAATGTSGTSSITSSPKSRLSLFASPEKNERTIDHKKKKKVPSHKVGFPNIYQTCYLNAILQCLLSQPSFVQSLLELKSNAPGRVPALLRSFCSLAEAKEEGNQTLVSKEILKLKNILSNLDSTFKGSSMQDADEFLLKFCDTLREQCKSLQEPDPITENIEYEMETVVTCSSCSFKNCTSSKNLICTLNSPMSGDKRDSIGGLLEKTFSTSQIEPWSCENCGIKNGSATLTSYFKTLPRVLILHVPRSNYDSLSDVKNQKIKLAISIFEYLNLSSVAIKDVAFPDRKCYSFHNEDASWSDDEDDDIMSQASMPETPEKLKNLSEEQIGKLNEEDSLALAIRYSLKETGNMSEDDQLRTAVNQSMSEEADNGSNANESSMDEACDLDAKTSTSISYQLASIVSHLGSSASSGHYIADVFRFDRKAWFRYNDMNVFKRSVDCVKSDENMRNGYLFIYTHCQLLPDP